MSQKDSQEQKLDIESSELQDKQDVASSAQLVNTAQVTRVRTYTEKGKEYQIQLSAKKFSSSQTRINRQCELLSHAEASNNYELVQQEMINLDKFRAEAEDGNLRLLELLPDSEKLDQQNLFDALDDQVFEAKHRACGWLKENDPGSRRSSRSSSRSSRSGNRSRSSVRSHPKSVNSNKSKASSKVETLKKEENILERFQEIKKEEIEHQMRLDKIKMEAEKVELQLKLVKAKREEEEEEDNHNSIVEHNNVPPKDKIVKLRGSTKPKKPKEKTDTNIEQSDILCAMMKLINLQTAPEVDIDVFNGDPLEYQYFRATFKDVVENKIHDPRERLIRLLKYTTGDVKESIKHCLYEEDQICFKEAIRILDRDYGDKHILINLYLNKLRKWPKIPLNNPSAYKKLHRFLLSGLTYKRGGKLSELDSEMVIRTCVLAKMDRSIQDKWLNKVVRA